MKQIRAAVQPDQLQPFPLYPGEAIEGRVKPMIVVENGQMLKIESLDDDENADRKIGEQWLINGPLIY